MKKEIEINILIGKRILSLRDQKNMSRSKLAKVIGITHQQLDKYEKGTNRISAAKIAIICQALKIDPAFFYSNLIMEKNITKDIQKDLDKLIPHFLNINNSSKRDVLINLAKELVI